MLRKADSCIGNMKATHLYGRCTSLFEQRPREPHTRRPSKTPPCRPVRSAKETCQLDTEWRLALTWRSNKLPTTWQGHARQRKAVGLSRADTTLRMLCTKISRMASVQAVDHWCDLAAECAGLACASASAAVTMQANWAASRPRELRLLPDIVHMPSHTRESLITSCIFWLCCQSASLSGAPQARAPQHSSKSASLTSRRQPIVCTPTTHLAGSEQVHATQ